jgi:hypothetical protein
MKKIIIILAGVCIIQACGNDHGETGAINDGIKTVDSNGALQDTAPMQAHPSTDTAMGEDRVDIQQRTDSAGNIK